MNEVQENDQNEKREEKKQNKVSTRFAPFISSMLQTMLEFILEILSYMKYLLAFTLPIMKFLIAVSALLFIGYLLLLKSYDLFASFFDTIYCAMCVLPLSSYFLNCNLSEMPFAKTPDFSTFVNRQAETYEQMIDQQLKNTATSAMTVAHHRIALRDLSTKIKHSTMTSATVMANKLSEIIDESRNVEDNLQKLEAKTRSSLDNMITSNTFALTALKTYKESKANIIDLEETYNHIMTTTGADLKKLILAATVSLGQLKNLDELMSSVYDIAIHEAKLQDINRKNLLTRIWYHLGHNTDIKENVALLANYEQWHKSATASVTTTISILKSFQSDMEELRDRVVEYNLVNNIPIELHIENVRMAIDRLRNTKAAQRSGVPQISVEE